MKGGAIFGGLDFCPLYESSIWYVEEAGMKRFSVDVVLPTVACSRDYQVLVGKEKFVGNQGCLAHRATEPDAPAQGLG